MALYELDNPATNSSNPQIGNKLGADIGNEGGSGLLSKIGSLLSSAPEVLGTGVTAVKDAAKGIGKYGLDTFTAERNSVPLSVRLAVAGARKAEDKLATLRQFYSDAMPTSDNDFTFIDPQTKKRVTLNDSGLSLGDALESMPEISEAIGATIGAIVGGLGGSAIAPGAGTITGGLAGAGVGGAAANELARQIAQKIASLLTGKDPIDSRTSGDYLEDAGKTAALNSGFAALPLGGRYLKNKLITERLLTPESAGTYKYLAEKGYDPTLGQIGSDTGKEVADRMVAGGIIKKEKGNQEILQKNLSEFLGGEVGALDENALANQFRASQKTNVSGKKETAQGLYDQVNFGDAIVPAENTKSLIENIYTNRGMVKNDNGKFIIPKGETLNPDLVLDSSMERKMQRIMSGKASEAELDSFRSDITTMLRDKNLKYDTKGTLIDLKDSLTNDLVQGSPELSQADREARRAWLEYKETQKGVKNLIGRSEGVTANTETGQGLTEAQSLDNAKKIFSQSSQGSDAEAQALAQLLSSGEKRTVLASILKENPQIRGQSFDNTIEKAKKNYNIERIGKYLVNPEDKALLDDVIKQAQGTKAIPEGFRDRSDLLKTEAALTGTLGAIDPSAGIGMAAIGNILRGAPGSAAGSGAFGTSVIRQSAPVKAIRNIESNMALNAAKRGEIPGQLSYLPQSSAMIPATMAGGQMLAGNIADSPESNLRISDQALNSNLPQDSKFRDSLPQYSLDDFINGNDQAKPEAVSKKASDLPSYSLDDFLQNKGTETPTKNPPVREMQPSVELPKTNEMGQKLPFREMQPSADMQASPNSQKPLGQMTLDDYIAQNYGDQNKSENPMGLDDYIAKNYTKESARVKPQFENKAIEKYKQGRAREAFKDALINNKDLLDKAGIKGERLNHFLAQLAHESGGFNHLEEIDPSKSNLSDKGGEKYKGRGWIQLTGDKNYKRYGDLLGLDLSNNPNLAADPDTAVKIAIAYWADNNLNDYADKNDIRGITRRINGGMNGFNDRKAWLDSIRASGGIEL